LHNTTGLRLGHFATASAKIQEVTVQQGSPTHM